MTNPPYETPAPPRKNWFGRNWWWFLPTVIGVPVALIVGFIGGIFFLVNTMMTSSQAYIDAMTVARQSNIVQTTLGTPIEDGWFTTGNINTSGLGANSTGHASLAIPISGPKGKGTLYLDATKSAGQWTIHELVFETYVGGYQEHEIKPRAPVSTNTPQP